ncbi:hypothetical protein LUZ61_010552 [Rhynchospora tenuis]|uniref:DYW domain-containing protein n=1 Tax=Rhynchospora tenuis TaxID=198213 RepID=A0AAD5ZZA9_9POAL|nr:hypothetical protein LUZ61_010552 [Rhynchospora tenuis]
MLKLKHSWPRLNHLSLSFSTQIQKLTSSSSSSSSLSYMALTQEFFDAMQPFTSPAFLPNARKLHAQIISIGLYSSVFLQNNLLNAYLKCSSLADARGLFDEIPNRNVFSGNMMINGYCKLGLSSEAEKVFDAMPERDVTTWNTLMSGYHQNGMFYEATKLFVSMFPSDDCEANLFSFLCAAKACSAFQCSKLSLQFLGFVERKELGQDPQVKQVLIDMFVKCGAFDIASKLFNQISSPDISCWNSLLSAYSKLQCVTRALDLFDKMPEKDIVSWNTMISTLLKTTHEREIFPLFSEMHRGGMQPNSTTYTCTLSACASTSNLEFGRQLHAQIVKTVQRNDMFVDSALVNLYAKCGELESAKRIFDNSTDRNSISWTAIISGFSLQGFVDKSVELFNEMRSKVLDTDKFTIVSLISACCTSVNLCLGNQLHSLCLKSGQISAIAVSNSLIAMYAKCNPVSAQSIFDSMLVKDVISWTSMITAYSQVGDVTHARVIFDKMPERNIVTWNAMIGSYIQHGYAEEGIKLYHTMLWEDKIRPNCVTFGTLFKGCADVAALKIGSQILTQSLKLGIDLDLPVANAIITMYSECGRIAEARKFFDYIVLKDLVSWNAMITAYSHHGMGMQAIETFQLMLQNGHTPDYITYVAVLSGCRHSGLLEQGRYYFSSMTKIHKISPGLEHYSCMIDLLGRRGLLEEAKGIIDNMSIKPTSEIWGALLSNCKLHKSTELAELAARNLFELDSSDSGSYMLLSEVYADAGNSAESAGIRKLMRDKGVIKKPGYSWIEVQNKVHVFMADESSHPHISAIKKELQDLIVKIVGVGYVKTEPSEALMHHSEKLAVVFGLMNLPEWMPIHVMKNLRICTDCHTVIKLISVVTGRELVIRDAVRFHHFREGVCSCGDYW